MPNSDIIHYYHKIMNRVQISNLINKNQKVYSFEDGFNWYIFDCFKVREYCADEDNCIIKNIESCYEIEKIKHFTQNDNSLNCALGEYIKIELNGTFYNYFQYLSTDNKIEILIDKKIEIEFVDKLYCDIYVNKNNSYSPLIFLDNDDIVAFLEIEGYKYFKK